MISSSSVIVSTIRLRCFQFIVLVICALLAVTADRFENISEAQMIKSTQRVNPQWRAIHRSVDPKEEFAQGGRLTETAPDHPVPQWRKSQERRDSYVVKRRVRL